MLQHNPASGGAAPGRVTNQNGTFKHTLNNFAGPRTSGGMTATGAQHGPYASPPYIPGSGSGRPAGGQPGTTPIAANSSGVWQPTGVPQPVSTAPATPVGGPTFNQPGIGTYTTGITAGQLPQTSIDSAMGRLNPSQNLSAGAPYGTPANRSQQGELNTLLQDQLRAGTWDNKGELARDSAFQQAQMQLAYDRARGSAALGGYTNLYNQQADQVNNDQARQSMLLNLLNAIGGLDF